MDRLIRFIHRFSSCRFLVGSGLLMLAMVCASTGGATVKRTVNKVNDTISVTLVYDDTSNLYGAERDGKLLVPIAFKEIKPEASGFVCRVPKSPEDRSFQRVYHFYDMMGRNITEGWDNIEWISTMKDFRGPVKFLSIKIDGKYGVIDMEGRCVVGPKWDQVSKMPGVPFIVVVTPDDKKGVINGVTSEVLLQPLYDEIIFMGGRFFHPYFKTKLNGFEGAWHINSQSAETTRVTDSVEAVPPTKFASIQQYGRYYNCYSGDNFKGTCELRSADGKVLVKGGKYNDLYVLSNGMISYKMGIESGILTPNGKLKFHTHYNGVDYNAADSTYTTYLGNAKGRLTLDGTVIEEPKPTLTTREVKGRKMTYTLMLDEKGLYGVVGKDGNVMIPAIFDQIFDSDSTFKCYRDGCISLRDATGRELIPVSAGINSIVPLKYKKHGGYYRTFSRGKQGVSTLDGKTLVEPNKWHYVSPYEWNEKGEIVAYAVKGKEGRGIIDAAGKILVPPIYANVIEYPTIPGVYTVKCNMRQGLYSKQGAEIIPPKFTSISRLGNDHYLTHNGDFKGIYSTAGDCLLGADRYTNVMLVKDPGSGQLIIQASNTEEVAQFSMTGKLLSRSETFAKRGEYLTQASNAFEKKSWAKAADLYNKADKISSTFATTFNMGVCRYNQGDYSKALKHFKAALDKEHSADQHSDLCDLIVDTQKCITEKNERRAQLVAGIFSLVVNTGMDIYAMNQAQKQRRQAIAAGNYSAVDHSSSGYDNADDDDNAAIPTNKPKGQCGFCSGKGSTVESTANYGIKKDFYCDECQKTVTNGHYHRKCTHCNGTGQR